MKSLELYSFFFSNFVLILELGSSLNMDYTLSLICSWWNLSAWKSAIQIVRERWKMLTFTLIIYSFLLSLIIYIFEYEWFGWALSISLLVGLVTFGISLQNNEV